jgi:WD40 repeat protein
MAVPLLKTENPYVGPNPFMTADQHKFFGRDREISDLVTLLVADRIVLLFAPSGAGKTSLIQAGLIPAMESRDFVVLPIIRVNEPPAEHAANGDASNRYLRSALLSLSKEGGAAELPSVDPAGLTFGDYLDRIDSQASSANGNEPKLVVMIFDQFEEILTVDPTDIEAKDRFFAEVGAALRPPHRWALFSIREDYLAALDSYLRLIPTHLTATYRLDLLGPDAALQAIQHPARNAGIDFTDAAAAKLVDDLRQIRIQRPDGTMEERLGLHIEPVHLQVVCERIWRCLPPGATTIEPRDVTAQGSVNEALGGFYADAVDDVAGATGIFERDIRTWFNDRLITRQGIRDQILSTPPESGGLDNRAIGQLVDKHLVRKEERRGTTWFELAHDRLIGPVRQNNAEWFEANLSPLQRQAYLWDSQHRNESFLFNPEGLAEAEAWLTTYTGRLTDVEQDFLDQCRERERQRLEDLEERRRELEHIKERERLAQSNAELAEQRAREQGTAKRRLLIAFVIMVVIAVVAVGQFIRANWEKDQNRRLFLTTIIQHLQTEDVPTLLNDSEDDVAALLALQASRFASESIFDPSVLSGIFNTGSESASDPGLIFGIFNDTLAPYPFAHVLGEGLGTVRAVAFSPDGRRLAVGGDDGKVRLWTVEDRRSDGAPLDGPFEGVRALSFSPDGRRLAVGGCASRLPDGSCSQGELRIFDLASRQTWRQSPQVESEVQAVAFQPSSANGAQLLVWGSSDGQLGFWNPDDINTPPREVPVLKGGVFATAFSPDGRLLAVGGCEERQGEGDLDGSQCQIGQVKLFDPFQLPERPALFGPWGRRQSVVPGLAALRGLNSKDVLSLTFDAGATLLVAGSGGPDGGNVQLWDVRNLPPSCHAASETKTDEPPCTLQDPGAAMKTPMTAVAFRPGDNEVVASDSDAVRFWNVDSLEEPETNLMLTPPNAVIALAFRPTDDHSLVTGGTDGRVRLWDWTRSYDVPVEHLVSYLPLGQENVIYALASSPDAELPVFASGSVDGKLLVWDWTTPNVDPVPLKKRESSPQCNSEAKLPPEDRQAVWSVAISGNGRLLAAGYGDGTINVWDVVDLQPRGSPLCAKPEVGQVSETLSVRSLSFSQDGHYLASGSWNGPVLVWDIDAPSNKPARLDSGSISIRAVTFSPDGDTVVVGGCKDRLEAARVCSSGGFVLIWHWREEGAATQRLCCGADNINESIYSLAFNPAGTSLAAGTLDGTILRWNVPSFEPENPLLPGHTRSVRSLIFLNDETLISASNDSKVLKWNLNHPDDEPEVLARPLVAYSAAISPDGRLIATGDQYAKIQIAIVEPESLVDLVCPQVGRNLTQAEWNRHVGEDVPYEQTCRDYPPG